MIKNLKKLVASTLVLSMVMSNVTNVFANKQVYIDRIKISDSSPSTAGSDMYKVSFGWTEPNSYEADNSANVIDADRAEPHSIAELAPTNAGYEVNFRNATKNEAYGSVNALKVDKYAVQMAVDVNKELVDSSIYSFRATPWHNHQYNVYDKEGFLTGTETKRAPYVSDSKNIEALYLTDIDLKATTDGNKFTFTWKNPTYLGKTLFTGYNIYYDIDGKDKDKFITVKVNEANPNLTLSNGTYSYTTTIDGIEYGRFYNAKIEPLVGTNYEELRKASTPKQVVIDGITYPIGFSSRLYRFDGMYLTPSITLDDISDKNIQLSWGSGNYSKIEIFTSNQEGTLGTVDGYSLVGTLSGVNASLTSFILEKPDEITYYKVKFTFADGKSYMISDFVVYDPTYKYFEPFLPKIYEFYGDEQTSTPALNVVFNAFTREPVSDEEKEVYGEKPFVDSNVVYKVWITDDPSNFEDPSFFDNTIAVLDATKDITPRAYVVPQGTDSEAGQTVQVYDKSFSSYFSYENGSYVQKQTKDGKIYYIKIQAFRPQGDESLVATDLTYVKPLTDNISNPITLTNPPLRLELDEFKVPIKTQSSFNIEWQEVWNEAYDYESEQWYAVIGVKTNSDGTKEIVYGKEATDALNDSTKVIPLYEGEYYTGNVTNDQNRVKTQLAALGIDTNSEEYINFIMRESNLSDAEYEIFVTSYSNMEANGGYETYFNEKLLDEGTSWRKIKPNYADGKYTYTVDAQDDPSGALQPATSYTVYIRPYIILGTGEKVYSYNPGYVVGETLSDRDTIPVTPPTIILYAVDETQSSITFEFEYSDTFIYTFRYSNLLADYPDGGIEITNEELLANGTKYVNDKGDTMLRYTISNLAPGTRYYTWGNATYNGLVSSWSLPLEQETDPLTAPQPPRAIGLMDKENVKVVNQNNGTNYVNPSEDYFIIDFARIPEDENLHENSITENGDGSYIFDQLIPRFPGAYFEELVPNQKYYIRAKTVLTAVIDGVNAEYFYSYIVQISETSRFEDVYEVHVFDGGFEPDGITIIQVESEWSEAVVARSGTTDKEYDGDKDDILYPIPDSNFEITVGNDNIVYVYRGSGKDSSGNNNNLTDQRLISDLVQNGAYNLVADLSSYDSYNQSSREVKLPYRLVSALNSSKIKFTFKAKDTYLTTSFQDIDKIAKANNIKDFGNDSMLSIKLADKTNTYSPSLKSGSFITPAEKIIMTLETPTRSVAIQNTYDTMELAFQIKDRLEYETSNVYVASFDDYGNQKTVSHTYDQEVGTINVYTKMLTTYGAVKQNEANTSLQPDHYYNVVSQLNITDLNPYVATNPVYALQYNNLVAGIVKDKPEITMGAKLADDEFTALGRSGILISGDKVKREDAIASMVAVYELKTGSKISTTTSQGSVSGISKVSSKNKTAVNKAYDIGLYYDSNTNFSDTLTFDELFYMIDLVLTDSK